MLCGVWDGNQFSECGKIQSPKCQPTLNIDAYCIISLAREYWSPRIPQFAEADMRTTCEHCYEPWVWTHSHVSCYMYLGESWWWCVGAVREGRNSGSLFAPCGGAEWWLVSLGGTDHLPLAILHSSSPQFPEQHRYRRWSNMVQWIIFSR